jgi:hypothetical protein
MRHEVPLPPIWAHLQGKVRYVQQVSSTEYSASCPQCGGEVHPNGEWPDRLRIFVDEKPLIWCRRCNLLQFPDSTDGYQPLSIEQMEQWRQERIQAEQARKRSADLALENLRSKELWMRYHDAMDLHARKWWERQGIPEWWQDYWQLGWDRAHVFYVNGTPYETDTATIPLFDHEDHAVNIKHRLQNPPREHDKYRYELANQEPSQPLFYCDTFDKLQGAHVVAVEGEKKAMVTYARLEDNGVCMVGLPGTNPGAHIVDEIKTADRVTLVMDPGAKEQAIALAQQVGIDKCWLLIPPVKIDDGILAADMDKYEVARMLRSAVQLSRYVTGKAAVKGRARA